MHRAMTGADGETQLNRARDKFLRQHDRAGDTFAFGQIRRNRRRKGAAGAVGVFGADARRVERGKFLTVVKEIVRGTFEMAAFDHDGFRAHLTD